MNAVLRRLKQGNTHIFDFQTFITFLNLSKELKLIFSRHQIDDILKSVI